MVLSEVREQRAPVDAGVHRKEGHGPRVRRTSSGLSRRQKIGWSGCRMVLPLCQIGPHVIFYDFVSALTATEQGLMKILNIIILNACLFMRG